MAGEATRCAKNRFTAGVSTNCPSSSNSTTRRGAGVLGSRGASSTSAPPTSSANRRRRGRSTGAWTSGAGATRVPSTVTMTWSVAVGAFDVVMIRSTWPRPTRSLGSRSAWTS
ncbi:hypothetical protein [Umezawaea sp. NPDC059074]|uniref:hypothetical protein n=1 Tax=Umezawaea sp. NPDC059074 TaxID=3346716 RepID=UPI0036A4B4C9